MTPMPIFIPISRGDETSKFTYPYWATGTLKIGFVIMLVGLLAMLICLTLWMITDDDRFDPTDKPAVYTFALTLIGMVVAAIGLMLMLFTGVPVEVE